MGTTLLVVVRMEKYACGEAVGSYGYKSVAIASTTIQFLRTLRQLKSLNSVRLRSQPVKLAENMSGARKIPQFRQ
jgi:hypothetical protein